MLHKWVLANFTPVYSEVPSNKEEEEEVDWRTYVHRNTTPLRKPLSNAGFLRSRAVITCFLLLNVVSLYMMSSTHLLLTPQISWTCVDDVNLGVSSTCKKFSAMDYYKHGICYMSSGTEFHWNFTYIRTPILEYGAYCPLYRLVEPKLINFAGLLCGSLLGGVFADSLGRKNVATLCIFFSILTTLVYKANSSMIMFTYLEFVKGAFTSVAGVAMLAWVVEQSEPRFCNLVVTLFFCATSAGSLATAGITRLLLEWRMVTVVIACAGILVFPLLLLVSASLRHKVARGGTKGLPPEIDFSPGEVHTSSIKYFLTHHLTNRIYLTNVIFALLLGLASHLLADLIDLQHGEFELLGKVIITLIIQLSGFVLAALLSQLPVFVYVVNVCAVLGAGVLALVASGGGEFVTENFWTQAKVFTGVSLMLTATALALAFTTVKQIPTLNRAFYISGLSAAYVLGGLFNTVLQSYCLKITHETHPLCNAETAGSLRLTACGGILLVSVVLAFINTCVARNASQLPHSYSDLLADCQVCTDEEEVKKIEEKKMGVVEECHGISPADIGNGDNHHSLLV